MRIRKVLSIILVLTICISVMPLNVMASTTPLPTTADGILNFSIARQTELESILLLQNNSRASGAPMLPLSTSTDKVAVFGNGQRAPISGSSGSGTVAGAFTYTLIEGLTEIGAGFDKPLADYYEDRRTTHGWTTSDTSKWGVSQYSGTGWNRGSPIAAPELKIDDGLVKSDGLIGSAKTGGANVAIVYLQRNVGTEEMDRASTPPQPSDWYLNPSEKTLLKQVTDKFDDVVLVVNTAGAIDMTFLSFDWLAEDPDYNDDGAITKAMAAERASKIRSIVWMYGAGSYHGQVLAQLLYGLENFSAKLADTITYEWKDHFTSKTFGGSQTYAVNGAKNGFGNNGASFGTRWGGTDPVTIYDEFVYSGYRYFDTFCGDKAGTAEDPVKYPFGYGKSYSEFNFSDFSIAWNAEKQAFTVSAKITNVTENTALPSGKEVLEVYLSAPNTGKLDQPYQILVGYNKTQKLAKGESEAINADIPLYYMASYDEASASYVMEPGDFIFRVGNSSRNTRIAGIISVPEQITVEQLSNQLTLNEADPEGKADNQAEFDAIRLNSQKAGKPLVNANDAADKAVCTKLTLSKNSVTLMVAPGLTEFVSGTAPQDAAYTLQSVADGKVELKDFVAQLTKDELAAFLSGGVGTTSSVGGNPFLNYSDDSGVPLVSVHSKSTASNVRSGGAGTSRNIQRLGIPSLTYADGGAGISISQAIATNIGYDRNAGYNRSAGSACTWNPDLQYKWGQSIGRDMRMINVDVWLAPSINLHRNPLNGRNTEYYSEDPILSGLASSYVSSGVASQGITVCLKHFAGNDQEQYRRGLYTPASIAAGTSKDAINTMNSERGLREVTLRSFEIPVRTGVVRCVMSAFNKINGQECAASSDLLNNILRGEWGFKGYVVTDWGDYDDIAHAANEMRSGNDMIMSGRHTRYSIPDQLYYGMVDQYEKDEKGNAIVGGRDDGLVSMTDMRRNAANVIYTIMNSKNAFDGGKYNTGLVNPAMTVVYHVKRNLSILSSSLPVAMEGLNYGEFKTNPLVAAGNEGTAFYKFSIVDGVLPNGLTLLGNGALTGAPAKGTAGNYPVMFQVEDSDGNKATKQLVLTVMSGDFNENLPDPRIGAPFSFALSGKGGTAPFIYSVDTVRGDALPSGLVLDAATGVISGTPNDPAEIGKTFNLVFNYKDSTDLLVTKNTSITLLDYITVSVTGGTSPMGVARGQTISRITVTGSRNSGDSFTYAYEGLPAGLSGAASNGRITGTVANDAEIKTYNAMIKVSLSNSDIFVNVPFTFTVYDADGEFKFITDTLPDAKANVSYSTTLYASGAGTKTYALDETSDKPNGFALAASTGVITWTPGAADFGYKKLVINAETATEKIQKTFWLYIDAGISITPAADTVFAAVVGEEFSQQIVAKGYATSVEYSISDKGDALPEGLEMRSDGLLHGTPLTAGNYNIVVVADEIGGALSGGMSKYALVVSEAGHSAISSVAVGVEQLVATYAANVPVTVAGTNLGAVYVKIFSKEGVLYGETDRVGQGKAIVSINAAQNISAGTYDVVVTAGTSTKTAELIVVPKNDNIWTVQAITGMDETRFQFADRIAAGPKGYSVSVGAETFIPAVIDSNILAIGYVSKPGDIFTISGVKYPTLFPSYSFTFTAAIPAV